VFNCSKPFLDKIIKHILAGMFIILKTRLNVYYSCYNIQIISILYYNLQNYLWSTIILLAIDYKIVLKGQLLE